MKAEYAGNLKACLSSRGQPLDDLASIGDECRQTPRGSPLSVRLNDASNASLSWLVVEKNAAASVHLKVDESGRQNRICRKPD